jgi:hypothetical protein
MDYKVYFIMLLAFLMSSSLRIIFTMAEVTRLRAKGLTVTYHPGMMVVNAYLIGATCASATGILYVTIKWLLA